MDTPLRQKLVHLAGQPAHPSGAGAELSRAFVGLGALAHRSGAALVSYGAIDFLRDAARPAHTVFEFGGGGSSVFLARRAQDVQSVENDPAWHAIVTARAQKLGLANLHCTLHAFGDEDVHRYAELRYFRTLEDRQFDLIIVDGFCGFTTGTYGVLRPHCFRRALQAVRPGGMIVVDDYWMYPEFATLAPRRSSPSSKAPVPVATV